MTGATRIRTRTWSTSPACCGKSSHLGLAARRVWMTQGRAGRLRSVSDRPGLYVWFSMTLAGAWPRHEIMSARSSKVAVSET